MTATEKAVPTAACAIQYRSDELVPEQCDTQSRGTWMAAQRISFLLDEKCLASLRKRVASGPNVDFNIMTLGPGYCENEMR